MALFATAKELEAAHAALAGAQSRVAELEASVEELKAQLVEARSKTSLSEEEVAARVNTATAALTGERDAALASVAKLSAELEAAKKSAGAQAAAIVAGLGIQEPLKTSVAQSDVVAEFLAEKDPSKSAQIWYKNKAALRSALFKSNRN